ncbi:class I SAM-dependent methyltransferase [Streptomyces sp. NPDC059009]|uniref:class I SAM-dependent methyltransferase n=1 Tax=Streptomyces sp. NPDC059009 TaxID=3346694 RepID=UPI0036ACE713
MGHHDHHGAQQGSAHTQSHGQGHGHGHHGHDTELDWAAMIPHLEQNAEVTAPLYRDAAAWLRELRPAPATVVDAGSGPGVVSCLLAEEFPGAQVIAMDPEEALLERAAARAAREGLDGRLRTLRAELPEGIGELPPADLIWAARSLHHVGDQGAALAALGGRLTPGGALAVLEGGLPARYLPRDLGFGRPGLQARLDATEVEWFAQMRAGLPGAREAVEDWPTLLDAAGLRHVATRTFLLDLPAPLSEAARAHVMDQFTRFREGFAEALAPDDKGTLDRLLDPDDPQGLSRRPDLFLLAAHTVHVAVKE